MASPSGGRIELDIRDSTPDWSPYLAPRAREGAPNVVFLVWDDLGYATMDVFGGPVETPNMRRLTERGVKLANFHTTALCSPTRASLLTGRNATTNGMATVTELTAGFPGVSGCIPFESGFISEVLMEQGYNTYAVGKWHLTPAHEENLAAYKGRWPLGRGFERFYGFLAGASSSWYPDLVYDNHPVEPPGSPESGYHLSTDLTDRAIGFVRDAKMVDPDKPFFLYFASQAGHSPHHVPLEWADRYRGRFDEGYEAIRAGILARQKELGLLPAATELSPINPHGEPATTGPDGQPWPLLDTVRPWDSLTADEQRLFARMMEVFAGYVSHADHEAGRLIDYLEESGQLDNTLIVCISDNGASGEGGPNGTFNEMRFFNGIADSTDDSLPHIDELGTPTSFNNFATGWAWAIDTPFPYWKRWAGFEGGIADMAFVVWPDRIPADPMPRQQYVHAVDVVPTVYDLLDIELPSVLKGYRQHPIEGESFAAALTDPGAPGKRTQFYAMLGQRSIYHDGWLATSLHPPISGWGNFDQDTWELYDLEHDRAQTTDLADRHPERLAHLKDLWFYNAGVYNGLPLDDRTTLEQVFSPRPSAGPDRDRYTYYTDCGAVPEFAGVAVNGRSFTIAAGLTVDTTDVGGVIYAHGGVTGGHSLYVSDRRLRYTYNWLGTHLEDIVADRTLDPGVHVVSVEFVATGPSPDPAQPGTAGIASLYIDDHAVGTAAIVTQPGYFCPVGEGICVGRDDGSPVTPAYATPNRFTGGMIDKVVIDVSGTRYIDHEAEVRGWFAID